MKTRKQQFSLQDTHQRKVDVLLGEPTFESKKLSKFAISMEFDFLKPIVSCSGKAQVDFIGSGICHGFVLWIDWVLDSVTEISTGPDQRYWRQGVKLLKNPIAVGMQELGHVGCETEASFDPTSGDLTIKHSFS